MTTTVLMTGGGEFAFSTYSPLNTNEVPDDLKTVMYRNVAEVAEIVWAIDKRPRQTFIFHCELA